LEKASEIDGEGSGGALEMQIKEVSSPWFRYFIAYDPATACG
jgi:hypothetical protein